MLKLHTVVEVKSEINGWNKHVDVDFRPGTFLQIYKLNKKTVKCFVVNSDGSLNNYYKLDNGNYEIFIFDMTELIESTIKK